jgi:hypothetical protein
MRYRRQFAADHGLSRFVPENRLTFTNRIGKITAAKLHILSLWGGHHLGGTRASIPAMDARIVL